MLYEHQKEALKKMHNGCILYGTVGSGKSLTALAYYFKQNGGDPDDIPEHPMNDPPQDLYIITTARKRDTFEWEGDMAKLLIGKDGVYRHKVVIDSWNRIGQYIGVKDAFFIFDEQRVVGSGAWVKAFLKIARENNWILLSATPGDTWSDYIPVFIANGYVRNRSEFNREHVIFSPFTRFPKVERYIGTGILIKWRDEILVPMSFERKVVYQNIDIWCEYRKDVYKDVTRHRWNVYEKKPIENASEYCQVLRRICNADTCRVDAVMDILSSRGKAIVFYNFNYELDILKKAFEGSEYQVAEWNGHEHQAIPDTEKWVYLVQYTAGAEGWNCITCDTIIFYSLNYSYKTMEQARGRIDRLNTPYDQLYFYRLRSRSGIDLAIASCLAKKKDFSEIKFHIGKKT